MSRWRGFRVLKIGRAPRAADRAAAADEAPPAAHGPGTSPSQHRSRSRVVPAPGPTDSAAAVALRNCGEDCRRSRAADRCDAPVWPRACCASVRYVPRRGRGQEGSAKLRRCVASRQNARRCMRNMPRVASKQLCGTCTGSTTRHSSRRARGKEGWRAAGREGGREGDRGTEGRTEGGQHE